MNITDRLRRAVESPNLFGRGINRLYHRRFNSRSYNTDGTDIFAEDWDVLLVLDACRYDTFEAHHDLPGRLESRVSRGAATVEFLRGNFVGRTLADTVYVTANPQLYRNRGRLPTDLHAVVDVWRADGWDEDHGTVLPETVNEYARRAAERYPKKRLVVHYIQPHYPFIGADTSFDQGHLDVDDPDEERVWDRLMTGTLDVAPEEVRRLYVDNLLRVLPHVEDLLTDLTGRTVVTADHGNMLGERASPVPVREWGHPRGIYTEHLVRVPWLVSDEGPRRTVVAEETADVREVVEDVDEAIVSERLEDLGYR